MWYLREQGSFAPGVPQMRFLPGEAGNRSEFKSVAIVPKTQVLRPAAVLHSGNRRRSETAGLSEPSGFGDRHFNQEGIQMDELFEKMKKLIASKLEVDEGKITMEASFRQDLGADSLDTYELVYAIEEEMGISIPDEKANEFETVKDAYEYIKSQQK
jgi:acyl carrier protein